MFGVSCGYVPMLRACDSPVDAVFGMTVVVYVDLPL